MESTTTYLMRAADAASFEFMQSVPKRSTAFTKMTDAFQMLRDVIGSGGAYIPKAMLTEVLGVSRQRVDQIIDAGYIKTFVLHGKDYVTETDLRAYIEAAPRHGHEISLPKSKREALSRALALGKESSSSDK